MYSIRQCPDCKGRGKFWVPPHMREDRQIVLHTDISSTAVSFKTTMREEYEKCVLCGGSGKVECKAIETDK